MPENTPLMVEELEALEGALTQLSGLLSIPSDSTHIPDPTPIEHAYVMLEELLDLRENLPLRIRNDGAITFQGRLISVGSPPHIGHRLHKLGIRAVRFDRRLRAPHLVRLLRILKYGIEASHPEHDAVTFWFESQLPGVHITLTELPNAQPTQHLDFSRLERALLVEAPELPSGPLQTLATHTAHPLDADDRQALLPLCSVAQNESPDLVRRRFGLCLMSAMGTRETPTLAALEHAFLACKLVSEQFIAGEYEEALAFLRNLESLNNPGARLPSHTREHASTALKHLCSNHMLMILAKTSEQFDEPPPTRLVAWYIEAAPFAIWRSAITRCAHDDIESLIRLFLLVYPPTDPFWAKALSGLETTRRSEITTLLASRQRGEIKDPWNRDAVSQRGLLHRGSSQLQGPDDNSLFTPLPDAAIDIDFDAPSTYGIQDDDDIEFGDAVLHDDGDSNWEGFQDLDDIQFGDPVFEQKWDPKLDAFLAPQIGGNSTFGLPNDASVLNSMLGQLEELERSAIKRAQSSSGNHSRMRRRKYWKS